MDIVLKCLPPPFDLCKPHSNFFKRMSCSNDVLSLKQLKVPVGEKKYCLGCSYEGEANSEKHGVPNMGSAQEMNRYTFLLLGQGLSKCGNSFAGAFASKNGVSSNSTP